MTSLSIARLHPSRPLPAKGIPRSSRSDWMVPSSPAPPWSAGKTIPPAVRAGSVVSARHSRLRRRSASAGDGASRAIPSARMRSISPRERRPRAVSRQRTSWPAVSSARATCVPEARETSRSSELPPARTTTFMRQPARGAARPPSSHPAQRGAWPRESGARCAAAGEGTCGIGQETAWCQDSDRHERSLTRRAALGPGRPPVRRVTGGRSLCPAGAMRA